MKLQEWQKLSEEQKYRYSEELAAHLPQSVFFKGWRFYPDGGPELSLAILAGVVNFLPHPNECEIMSDKHTVRGADGGFSIGGGMDSFLGWLPLATAYWQPDVLEWLDEGIGGNFMRRAIPLP